MITSFSTAGYVCWDW